MSKEKIFEKKDDISQDQEEDQERITFQGKIYTSLTQIRDSANDINPQDLKNAIFVFAATEETLDSINLPGPIEAILRAKEEGRVSFRTDKDRKYPYKHVANYLIKQGIEIPSDIKEKIEKIEDRRELQELLKSIGLNIALADKD